MRVAVAIITDSLNRLLITQRPLDISHGGFWEFPGGKVETEETPADALLREIKEEVGLEIRDYQFLGEVVHSYEDKSVNLFVYHVNQFHGQAKCLEGQLDLKWEHIERLSDYAFPAANVKVMHLYRASLS